MASTKLYALLNNPRSHHRRRQRPFPTPNSFRRRLAREGFQSQVPLATTERTSTRNYRKFSQLEIEPFIQMVECHLTALSSTRFADHCRRALQSHRNTVTVLA